MDGRLRAGALAIFLAVCLGGCKERAVKPPAAAPPARLGQGSVNPDSRVTSYACIDGETITAGYPDRETAVVTYQDHAYTLKLAPASGGARYIGYGLQWWVQGAHASISVLGPGENTASALGLDCAAAQAPAAAATVTRTAFAPSETHPAEDP